MLHFVGTLSSTLKQVGLGRGRIIPVCTSNSQSSTVGRPPTLATSSSAFSVATLAGRSSVVTAGYTQFHFLCLLFHFGLCRAAAHSDWSFFEPCINILSYLLTCSFRFSNTNQLCVLFVCALFGARSMRCIRRQWQ